MPVVAPTIIGTALGVPGGSHSVIFPAHQVGDLLLLVRHLASGTAPATTPGWTSIVSQARGGDHSVNIQYKFADGEDSVGPFSSTSLSSVTVIRGVDRYDPIDAVAVINGPPSGSSTNFPYADLVTNTDLAMVLLVASSATDASQATPDPWHTFDSPNLIDTTEILDRVHPFGSGGGVSLYEGIMETAGATGTGSIEHFTGEVYRFTIVFALKPLNSANHPIDVGGTEFQPFVGNFITPVLTGVTELNFHPTYTVTPKAAIILGSEVSAVGSFAKGLGANFGLATAADQYSVSTKEEEKIPSFQREIVAGYSDRVVNVLNATAEGGEVPVAYAGLDSFIPRGVHLNWPVVDAAKQRIQTIALLGGNINVKAGKVALGTTDEAITITTGFKPNALIFFSPSRTASAGGLFNNITLPDSALHWGFASWDDTTVRQCAFARWSDQDAEPVADIRAGATENGVFTLTDPTAGYAEVGNFTATGFDLTTRVFDPAADSQEVCYIAIGNVNAWAGALDTPVGVGNQAYTAPGFQPKFGIVSLTNFTALDTEDTGAGTPAHIGMVHGVDNEFCYTWATEVSVPGDNTESRSREFLLDIVSNDTDTEMCQGNFVSWDANGFTLNFSTLSATEGWTTTARKMFGLYIG